MTLLHIEQTIADLQRRLFRLELDRGFKAETPPESPTLQLIIRAVAYSCGLNLQEILSKRRTARIVEPRQIAYALCRELTQASFEEIGEAFGGKDHGTILYGEKRILNRQSTEPKLKAKIDSIRQEIKRQLKI